MGDSGAKYVWRIEAEINRQPVNLVLSFDSQVVKKAAIDYTKKLYKPKKLKKVFVY